MSKIEKGLIKSLKEVTSIERLIKEHNLIVKKLQTEIDLLRTERNKILHESMKDSLSEDYEEHEISSMFRDDSKMMDEEIKAAVDKVVL